MRSIKTVALVAATLLLVPQLAAAADLDSEVQDMKQRLEQMETQLQAQDQELAAAKEDRTATSALSSFLEKTDISGFVAAGWNWSKWEAKAGDGSDDSFTLADRNTFQLDQAWIEMNKAPTEESRAGFNLTLESGAYATQGGNDNGGLGGGSEITCLITGCGDSNTLSIFSANVSYLAPIGNGLTVTAGIMPTALGAEVENQNGNWQISRGIVWGLQPVTNTGVTARYAITDQLSIMAGAINSPIAGERRDLDNAKGLTSQISFAAEKFSVNAGVNWGSQKGSGNACGGTLAQQLGGFDCDSEGILDVVATITPMDNLSFWVNYDYYWAKLDSADDKISVNGIAVAGRFGIIDSTGISGRFEYVVASAEDSAGNESTDNPYIWEITATVDHAITDGLTGKVEYRYERWGADNVDPYIGSNTVMVQMMYEF